MTPIILKLNDCNQKKEFRLKLIQRAVEETTKLRIIYDEECLRYYNILRLELNNVVLVNKCMSNMYTQLNLKVVE